jgi:sterol desaturase/sphingolipid hydroxylase (fatty acid hydroxylase superfamily)
MGKLGNLKGYTPFQIAWLFLVESIRAPLICTALCFALSPSFFKLRQDWIFTERTFFIAAAVAVHSGIYIFVNGFFGLSKSQGWFKAYAIERTDRMKNPPGLLKRTAIEAVVNHIVSQPVIMFLLHEYVSSPSTLPLPSPFVVLQHMACAKLFNSVFFYWTHRWLHSPYMYRRFHKQHHEYKGTIGVAAEFANPVESLISNVFPTVGYCFFARVHPLIFFVWLSSRLVETYEAHSGFDFSTTLLGRCGLLHGHAASWHDWHHSNNM